MNPYVAIFSSIGFLAASAQVLSAECDCRETIGQCTGSVKVVKSFGSKPSFGAELIVRSSETICSKVEYFVDNTPYQTILVNSQSEPESTSGTSPVTQASITYKACYVCKGGSTDVRAVNPQSETWKGSYSQDGQATPFSAELTFSDGAISGRISETNPIMGALGSSVSGSYTDKSIRFTKSYDGTNGVSHSVSYSGQLSVQGDSISGSWSFAGMSGSFEMSR